MANKRKLTEEEIEILKEKVKEGELELSLEDLEAIAGGVYNDLTEEQYAKLTHKPVRKEYFPDHLFKELI